ncbi:MAG: hypothetical protein R3E79_23740 [Caldilineaceae bacterium]
MEAERGGWGGNGGAGRIRIEYCESLTGSTNPAASTQKRLLHHRANQSSAARFNLPKLTAEKRDYRVQYGRKLDFTAPDEMTATLRIPAGRWTPPRWGALVSGVGSGDVDFKLDVGNNGTWDWEETQTIAGREALLQPRAGDGFCRLRQRHRQ